jgi:hypothetical protein
VLTVKVAWVTSIGQASNAVVGAGSPLPFSSIEAEWTSAVSKYCEAKVFFFANPSNDESGQYLYQ